MGRVVHTLSRHQHARVRFESPVRRERHPVGFQIEVDLLLLC